LLSYILLPLIFETAAVIWNKLKLMLWSAAMICYDPFVDYGWPIYIY
jgi:hypothetical protein